VSLVIYVLSEVSFPAAWWIALYSQCLHMGVSCGIDWQGYGALAGLVLVAGRSSSFHSRSPPVLGDFDLVICGSYSPVFVH